MKANVLYTLFIIVGVFHNIYAQQADPGKLSGPNITSESIVNDTCKKGSVILIVQADNPPLIYTWSDGSHQQELSNNKAGFYTVTITDKLGNSTTGGPYEIKAVPRPVTITDTWIRGDCKNTASGYIGFTTLSKTELCNWSHDPGLHSLEAYNLSPGLYSVTISDETGICKSIQLSHEVHDNTPVIKNLEVGGLSPCVTDPKLNGYVVIDLDCYYDYTFKYNPEYLVPDPPGPLVSGNNSNGLTHLWFFTPIISKFGIRGIPAPGVWNFKIHGYQSCNIDTLVYIPLLDNVSSFLFTTYPGKENHLYDAFAQAKGGQSPYTYKWSDGSTDQNLKDLKTGKTYYVTITDYYGCTSTTSSYIKSVKGNNEVHLINNGDNIEVRVDGEYETIQNKYSCRLIDIMGRTWSNDKQHSVGNTWQIDTSPLPSGLYYLIMDDQKAFKPISFIVIH